MPIRINLLSDVLAEQELRKRDPVKRAIYVGALLVALMLVWYSSIFLGHIVAKSNLSKIQSEAQSRADDYKKALATLQTLHSQQNRLKMLDKLNSARFLQGNLLNALQTLYVSNVNLMRLEVSQHYTPTGTAGKTTGITASTQVTLDACDSSPNPGDRVNQFKDAITQLGFFKSQLSDTDGLTLSSLSSPQTTPAGTAYVLFSLTCRFNDLSR